MFVRLREVEWAMDEFITRMPASSSQQAASHAKYLDEADKLAQEFGEVRAGMYRRGGEDSQSLARLFEITSRTIRLQGAWLREATEAPASLEAGGEAAGV